MKLYPPYIEGTLPAFCRESSGIIKLTIPFSMNRTVSPAEVRGFILKLKTAQNNIYTFTIKQTNKAWFTIGDNSQVTFILDPNNTGQLDGGDLNNLSIGQYYKAQLAYIANDENSTVGYYSSVGIIKYTTQPTVQIQLLTPYMTNNHIYSYTGVYRQYKLGRDGINESDVTEKEYSYQFILTDKQGKIIDDTGIQIHNVNTNVEAYESIDEYKYDSDLIYDEIYYIQYIVYTNNKMTVKSPKYKILQKRLIPPNIDANLKAEMNFDNGYVDVKLTGNKNAVGNETVATGAFIISRACSTDNFKTWNEIFRFSLHADVPSHQLFRDFTVEQGKEYVYGLQQYNDYGMYSARLLSNVITADFEDTFLYDGYRQLKIRFNPKVSSFKTTLLESKIDTIGSKYPFVFRNGKVSYKEFPINGLISYLSDEAQLFMSDEELGLNDIYAEQRTHTVNQSIFDYTEQDFNRMKKRGMALHVQQLQSLQEQRKEDEQKFLNLKVRTTQPEAYNIAAERAFKLAVLDWLNNGGIKLFRSPGEGNYLVRLMNVSLTPEDRVGRMIHNFQCTAYEMSDFNYDNLLRHGIVTIHKDIFASLQQESIQLCVTASQRPRGDSRYVKAGSLYYARGEMLTKWAPATAFKVEGVQPGSKFIVEFKNGGTQEIVVGPTGNYELDITEEIASIIIPDDAYYEGILTYTYYLDTTNTFNEITNFYIHERLGQQYIGTHNNIIDIISDEKFVFTKFYYLHFYKRDIEYIDTPLSSYDNSLYLYCLSSEDITVLSKTTGIGYVVKGIIPVSSTIVKANLISNDNNTDQSTWVVPECYYYYKNRQLVQSIGMNQKSFNNDIQYYELKPFEIYYSPEGTTIVSQSDYNRIIEYLTITTRQEHIISNLEILSTEIEIDGSKMDLIDTAHFYIDDPINFSSIKIPNGVYLECGYELQEILYSIEDNFKERDEYSLYFKYKYYLSGDYYDDMMNGVNGILEADYNQNVAVARQVYPELYQEYLQQLVREIK